MEKTPRSNSRKIIQLLLLLLIIVVLPGLSWWYLQKGLDYRRASLGQLGEYGQLPTSLTAQSPLYGEWPDSLGGNMYIIGWLPSLDPEEQAAYGQAFHTLHEQFDNPTNIYFVNILPQDRQAVDSLQLQHFLDTYELADPQQVLFITPGARNYLQLADAFQLPQEAPTQTGAPAQVAMVDAYSQIRGYFNLADPAQQRKLIEITAMILPRGETPDIILKRDTEK